MKEVDTKYQSVRYQVEYWLCVRNFVFHTYVHSMCNVGRTEIMFSITNLLTAVGFFKFSSQYLSCLWNLVPSLPLLFFPSTFCFYFVWRFGRPCWWPQSISNYWYGFFWLVFQSLRLIFLPFETLPAQLGFGAGTTREAFKFIAFDQRWKCWQTRWYSCYNYMDTLCKDLNESNKMRTSVLDVEDTKRDMVSARITYVLCTPFSELVCCTIATMMGLFLLDAW